MTIINPKLARFAALVNDAYERVCEEFDDDSFFGAFAPMGLELRTCDGLTARFWEEGIEFYPAEDKGQA